ncbi:epoxyqueuosine reductase QueH [Aminipila sp.]|uniref:epoxyqueuosine reductase QueH n=1 Tax=Aminipila sp. TaxID=2060095 RepID=UPI00289AD10B|nr:epoxyqueuosine reductase QueH [Aminipila sp.]
MSDKKQMTPLGEIMEQYFNKGKMIILDDIKDRVEEKPKLMLHSCCGPCSTAVIERLTGDYNITIFFYNPNITEKEEYEKRKAEQIKFLETYNQKVSGDEKVSFIEGEFFPQEFFQAVKGLEEEPEGGKRCTECFKLRLERTAAEAKLNGYELFGTTLTVSPHKNYLLISKIGRDFSLIYGLSFLDMDFKKKAGYQRSIELSKEYGLYRQNYCGCCFSKWE